MKTKKGKNTKLRTILTVTISVLISAVMVVSLFVTNMYSDLISNVLNASTTKIINPVDDIYTSDYSSYEELVAHEEEVGQQVEEEGIVLLKNDNKTLPLSSDSMNVSVFGQDSVDFVYGGSGSGSVSSDKAVSLKTALEAAGFTVNDTLWNFYANGDGSSYRKTYKSETGAGEFAVNEVPVSLYTAAVTDSFSDFNDAAIVVFGRSGGESADLPTEELSTGYMYLQIDQNERDMLQMACDNFDKVIVIINSSNAMELSFLDEYDVDACVWAGAAGQTGVYAIGEVLNGTINPSGRLVDTYAYDSTSAPSFVNLGNYNFTNEGLSFEDKNNMYLVYEEGIYVGYRYYETRYEDAVLQNTNVGSFDYSTQVQFPFGYGLSYTDFSYDNYSVTDNGDTFLITVDVTNTGAVAGKDTVEIYMQSPYTEYDIANNVEKASVVLVGFAKTELLEAGATKSISISVDKENMKSYDTDGLGTYIVDAGDYYFALGTDAHNALNNILAAKGYSTSDGMTAEGNQDLTFCYTVDTMDSTTYAVSQETGNPITNEFENADIRSYDDGFVYLSRSNWTGTWPTVYQDGSWEASDQLVADLAFYQGDEVLNDGSTMPATDAEPAAYVYASDLIGASYDDALWETLLDELSVSNLTKLVRMGGYATISIDAISFPATTDKDGPSGFSSSIIPGRSGMAYPAEVVMASTWNVDLINEVGKCIGEDSLALGISGWYGPGVNTHRSPYSGRNFEYFSEDGYLAGMICAYEVDGARSKGTIAYMKHFALNDQETNRYGGAIFANEQAIREVFLKSFELTVRYGKITAAMASMNRIGARWSGADYGLMTATLRDEWGFQGMVITDQASVLAMLYQDMISGLYGGTDLWLNTNSNLWSLSDYKSNATVMNHVRNAAHNIIYTITNSNAMNGISPDTKVITIMPWWRKALWGAAAVVWLLSIAAVINAAVRMIKKKKVTIKVSEEN